MKRLTPPQPTDVWKDEDTGKVWFEYSYHEIMEWNMERFIRGIERRRTEGYKPKSPTINIMEL
jgi:hypothetical protein